MLNEKIEKMLNEHLNYELYSSYIYLSMAAYCESIDLKGFANWMRIQVQEELSHVTKFYDYIHERDGKVLLTAIDGPPTSWDSPVAAFVETLEHEQSVTGRINNLVKTALEENDFATHTFLQWFITEQVEEEASVRDVLQKVKMVGDSGDGLFLVDRELGQRVFTPPATA
ncbi:MAG: ferritin [Deltaproteobacteria bacterium]|nr:ferritin [Deltaproteobacteria bacterium]